MFMKIKFTPEICYMVSLWKNSKTREGIGIYGDDAKIGAFIKTALELKMTKPNKFQIEKNKVYFYHSAYRAYFDKMEKELIDKIKYMNEYFYNYVAGMLDSKASVADEKEFIIIGDCKRTDEMIFLRLGLNAKLIGKNLIVKRSPEIEYAIAKFCKVFGKK